MIKELTAAPPRILVPQERPSGRSSAGTPGSGPAFSESLGKQLAIGGGPGTTGHVAPETGPGLAPQDVSEADEFPQRDVLEADASLSKDWVAPGMVWCAAALSVESRNGDVVAPVAAPAFGPGGTPGTVVAVDRAAMDQDPGTAGIPLPTTRPGPADSVLPSVAESPADPTPSTGLVRPPVQSAPDNVGQWIGEAPEQEGGPHPPVVSRESVGSVGRTGDLPTTDGAVGGATCAKSGGLGDGCASAPPPEGGAAAVQASATPLSGDSKGAPRRSVARFGPGPGAPSPENLRPISGGPSPVTASHGLDRSSHRKVGSAPGSDPALALGLLSGRIGDPTVKASWVSRVEEWVRGSLAGLEGASQAPDTGFLRLRDGPDPGVSLRWRPTVDAGVRWLLELRVDPSLRTATREEWGRLGETLAALGVRLQVATLEPARDPRSGEGGRSWHPSRYPGSPDGSSDHPDRRNSHGGKGMPWREEDAEVSYGVLASKPDAGRIRVG